MTSFQKAYFTILFLLLPHWISAQYFGKNKPGYKEFNFKVIGTPNFEIYHYLDNDSLIHKIASQSEQWYRLHQLFIKDTIPSKNPIILYENHGDFQQTNVSQGTIDIGTGGFTEGLKNRVVIPLSMTDAQTDHVLGHELVHAFQYNHLLYTANLSFQDLRNIPLWMIEGMAEYLSVGSVDPQTAMWLRDDVMNNNLPTLYEMSRNPIYNPYRYGQAFWAFTAKTWGDTLFAPLLSQTAKTGLVKAMETNLGVTVKLPKNKKRFSPRLFGRKKHKQSTIQYKTFDSIWHKSIVDHFSPLLKEKKDTVYGKVLFDSRNAGNYNCSPVISPNGKFVLYISEKDLFAIDLFLAETENGKTIDRFSKHVNQNEIDAFNFIESAGAWSPDSRYFAYVVYKKGGNSILIVDAERRKVTKEINPEGILSISNPAWSPDGKKMAFAGQVHGLTDIFLYDLESMAIEKLTHDGRSNIQPNWSPNGKYLVYVKGFTHGTDDFRTKHNKKLALYSMEKNSEIILDIFDGANNLDPHFSPDNNSIFFLSDRDGFRNLYRYSIETKKIYQQTEYFTGIAGITMTSPAISISMDGTITYSLYTNHKYKILKAHISDFSEFEVENTQLNNYAATLPPILEDDMKNQEIEKLSKSVLSDSVNTNYFNIPYRPKFQLDYISEISAGISSSFYGPGVAGGTSAIFSDIIGDNLLFVNLNLNGTINDFGGSVAFINQKKRLDYGFAISHIPYYTGKRWGVNDTAVIYEDKERISDIVIDDLYRIFETRMMLMAYYPISTTMRFESSISLNRYGYRFDQYLNFYDSLSIVPYNREKREKQAPSPTVFAQTNIAFVLDNSHFGLTSPLRGARSRIELAKNFGHYNHYSTLIDFRKYYFKKPIGLAFRILNHNRFGANSEYDDFNTLFIGYPWYIRGYNNVKYSSDNNNEKDELLSFNKLTGSKMIVSNFEIRIPFTGPEKISLIKSKIFFSDINLFADAGLIWNNSSKLFLKNKNSEGENIRSPLTSIGTSLRINFFGYIVLEPYLAIPFQNPGGNRAFGINILPGW